MMKYLLYVFLLFHLHLSAQITTFPYIEDFDSDDGSWTTSGTNNSWEWGTPNNEFIYENETCGGNAWVTNLTGSYNNSELSYLESPVFDLSGFTNDPVINFQLIREIEFSSDQAYLEVSTDGVSWSKVTNTGSATNWYNDTFNGAWGGNSDWGGASNTLTGLAGESTVYLRFVLETSGFVTREGIGIDLFVLSEGPLDDVLVIGIDQPESGCDLSDEETIEVALFNDSASPVENFQVCFEIDSNTPVCETFTGPIAAGSVGTHIFTAKGDFSAYGMHIITVSANPGDAITCNNELSESIENVEGITTFPHYQDFEAGEANWTSGGFNNSWAFGTPNKFVIKGASSGVNAWTTGGLTGEYNEGESSSVTSPCFDLSSIPNDYYVGADIWWESDGGTTGTILQVSTDNGDTWTTIGALNEPVNWYNDQLSAFGVTNDVWAGENASGSGEWVFAYHSIPSNFIGEPSVRFRFLFEEANLFGQETSTADGFAFDNFFIGPQPSLEVDYCTNPIILDAGKGFTAYAWSNTAMTQTIDASPGTYNVTVTDVNSNNITYSVEVSNIPLPTAIIEANFQNCGTAILTANDGFTTYTWSTGASTQSIFADMTRNYIVTVTNAGGCTATDEIFIETEAQPLPTISGDLLICANETTLLTVNSNLGTYQWSNGSMNQTITAIPGIYTVTVSNGADCTNSASVEVSENANPIPTISGNLSYCENENTILDVGAGFNTYAWSSGQSSQTITATEGMYTVTVSNAESCTGTNSVEVSENANPLPTISGNLSYCENDNTVLDAGTGFNTYAWSNGESSQTITATEGTYTVTVSNAESCTGTNSVEVSENANPIPTINGNLSYCENDNTVLDAGAGFNTYAWSSGQSSQTITATEGTYTVTVSNAESCTGTNSVEVSENANPIPTINGNLSYCENANTLLDVGSGFNTYAWSSGQSSQTITATEGTYTVTVSNAESCTGTSSVEVSENANPIPTINGNLSYCENENTILDAGAGFNIYAWSSGQSSQTITATEGTYTVTVSNAESCTGTSSVEVSENADPIPTINGNLSYCENDNTVLDAGAGFNTYAWSSGQSTQTITATEGTYTVTVSNAESCTGTSSVEVSENANPIPTISGNLSYCENANTVLDAGSGFNTYAWSSGQSSQTITATEGTYTVTVSNAESCTGTSSVEVSENANPIPTINGNLSYCENANTVLDAGSGFNTYAWSSGQSSQTITATEGTYTVTVSNAESCTGTSSVEVSENANPIPTISGNLSYCENDNTVLDAGVGFNTYAWSSGQSTQTITATEGTYTVTVSNAESCKGTSSVEVSENASAMPTISGNLSYCENANTVLDAGSGFNTYAWSSGQNTQTITATAGIYTVTVSSGTNCIGATSVEVSENPLPMPVISGEDVLCPNEPTVLDAGTGFNTYAWSSGETTQTITVIAGTYTVTVSNEEGCLGEAEIEITEREGLAVVEGSESFVPYMSPVGMDGFIFTICGGEIPYAYSFQESGGFVSSNIFYASPNCQTLVVYYVYGTEWSLTIEDECGDLTYTKDDVRVLYPQVDSFDVTHENCTGDENGSITVNVSGGETDSCGDYTYNWSNTSGFSATTQTISNLASGVYHVTITDCEGDETASEIQVGTLGYAQSSGRGRGRGRRGRGRGCPVATDAGKTTIEAHIIADAGFLSLHPNPFQTSTTVQFLLDETDNAWLSVYSSDGKKIKDLLKGVEVTGNEMQSLVFDSEELQPGIYLLQLRTNKGVFLYEKMIIGQ